MSLTEDVDTLKARSVAQQREQEALRAELADYKQSVKEQIKGVYERLNELAATSAKPWWRSKGMVGSYGTIVGTAAMVAGYILEWPPEAMAMIASATGISGGVAAHGRKYADKAIR